jgi:hypothetical protein
VRKKPDPKFMVSVFIHAPAGFDKSAKRKGNLESSEKKVETVSGSALWV